MALDAETRRARMRKASRQWRRRHPGRQYAAVKSWTERHREARSAQLKVYRAIKRGDLVRPDACETPGCSRSDVQAHHDDYSKPLVVRFLCPPCHRAADDELREAA